MRYRNAYVICLIIFGIFVTAFVWPFWYNHIWNGLVLHGDYSYFHTELLQYLSALLIILPAFVAFPLAVFISRKSKSKALRLASIIFFGLFTLVIIWWVAGAIIIATHPPVGG